MRRFIDTLPKEVKMQPTSWVPGYRSIVEKRRQNGLSGAGITSGVDSIVTLKIPVTKPAPLIPVTSQNIQQSTSKHLFGNYSDFKGQIINQGSKYVTEEELYRQSQVENDKKIINRTRVWSEKTKNYEEKIVPFKTCFKIQDSRRQDQDQSRKLKIQMRQKNSANLHSGPANEHPQTHQDSMYLHSKSKYRPVSSHQFRAVKKSLWIDQNNFTVV